MSIRTDLELDITSYKSSLKEADRAAVKYARRQERNYQKQQKEMKAIETELRRLRSVREASNNPKAIRQYTAAIEKLEKEQEQLRKETQKYSSAVDKSSKKTEGAFKRIGRSAKMWLAGTAAGAILTITSLVRDMGGEMMRFNEEMNKSLAIQGNVTMEQRNRMEQAAKEVARELNMATDKVAQGYFYLASAGLDVEEQIANLPKVAEFAKAGMFDLATATDLATDAQSALGMTVENTTQNQRNLVRVTDTLVSANQQANATVQQFSEALTNKGATALRNVNKDIEEGVALLAAYADQGIKGRRAGEYLSRTLRILSKAANENIEQFKELGIVTAEGNLADFPTIIQALTEELGGLSDTAMTAKMEQMGFTSEVQEAIKPVLGLSDEVAQYEKNLRQAGGAAEEVADKQMKSLTERLGSLKRQLVDTFGDDVVSGLETTVNLLEDMYEAVVGTQEEIRKEQTVEGALQGIGGLFGSDMTGWNFNELRRELESLYDTQQKNTEEFSRQNREMTENIESYSTWASEVEGAQEKVADANEELRFREMVLKRNIERNKELIQAEETSTEQKAKLSVRNEFLNRKLESTQKALSKTREYFEQTTEEEEKQEQAVSNLADQYLEYQDNLEKISILGDKIGQMGGGEKDIVGTMMQEASGYVEEYNQKLTKANNLVQTGEISQQKYEERVKDASKTLREQLTFLYKMIKDNLTPAQQEMWEGYLSNIKDATEGGDDLTTSLEDIADTVDSIVNVAEAVGGIGDKARQSLSGLSDMLRATSKLSKLGSNAGFLDFAVPGIGLASGLITTISGLVGGGGPSGPTAKEMQELSSSLSANRVALQRNTEALYEQATIGSDVSESDIERGSYILDLFDNWNVPAGSLDSFWDELTDIAPEIFEPMREYFQEQRDKGVSPMEAMFNVFEKFNPQEVFSDFADSVGDYGNSIQGAMQEFQDAIEFGGLSVEEAFDQFIKRIAKLESDIPDDIWQQLQNLDPTTEEGQNQLENIIKRLFENEEAWRGDMTSDEWDDLLSFLKNQSEGSASGSEAGGYSRSVQIARTITDVQANEMIMFLERIEKWTRDTAAAMGSNTAISVNESGGMMPSLDIPIPLPVTIQDEMPGGNGTTTNVSKGTTNNSFNFNIGDISPEADNLITDEMIDEIGRRFTKKLKQQIRSSQF